MHPIHNLSNALFLGYIFTVRSYTKYIDHTIKFFPFMYEIRIIFHSSMTSSNEFKVITEDVVTVFISSNCKTFTSENRFAKSTVLAELRAKLELITGASAAAMKITVLDKDDKKVRQVGILYLCAPKFDACCACIGVRSGW